MTALSRLLIPYSLPRIPLRSRCPSRIASAPEHDYTRGILSYFQSLYARPSQTRNGGNNDLVPSLGVSHKQELGPLPGAGSWWSLRMCRQRLSGWSDSIAFRQSLALVLTLWLPATCVTRTGCMPKAGSSALSK